MLNLVDYLIQANIAIIAFGAICLLIKRFTTFFLLNRYLLLFGLCFSLLYPFIHINQAVVGSHIANLPKFRITKQEVLLYSSIPENSGLSVWTIIKLIYLLGAGVFLSRLAIQFISLQKLYQCSTKEFIKNYPVRVLAMDNAPFSFWKATFINPSLHTDEDIANILEHEYVHIKQWHFIDVLFCELLGIFFWINPIIWIFKKCIRENLEFITDKTVLDSGINIKAYQYSLINVTLLNCNWLGNNFKSSTMKKRITMINAKRTPKFFLGIYIVLIPLCCFALLLLTSANTDLKKTLSALPTRFQAAVQKRLMVKTVSAASLQHNVRDIRYEKPAQEIIADQPLRLATDTEQHISMVYFVDNVSLSIENLNDDLINHMQHLYVLTPDQFKSFNPKTFPNSTLISIVITDSEKAKQLNEKLSVQYQDNTKVISNLKTLTQQVAALDTLSAH